MNTTQTTTAPDVTLGATTYTVETWTHTFDADGEERTSTTTVLTGPRGAQYFLRGNLGADTGRRQVISFKSGQPLRVRGNEVRVYLIGDVIEAVA